MLCVTEFAILWQSLQDKNFVNSMHLHLHETK